LPLLVYARHSRTLQAGTQDVRQRGCPTEAFGHDSRDSLMKLNLNHITTNAPLLMVTALPTIMIDAPLPFEM
jgi:hypothetical protein